MVVENPARRNGLALLLAEATKTIARHTVNQGHLLSAARLCDIFDDLVNSLISFDFLEVGGQNDAGKVSSPKVLLDFVDPDDVSFLRGPVMVTAFTLIFDLSLEVELLQFKDQSDGQLTQLLPHLQIYVLANLSLAQGRHSFF